MDYKGKRPWKPKNGPCVRCGKIRSLRARGLCGTCGGNPVLRDAYPHIRTKFNAYLFDGSNRKPDSGKELPQPTAALPGSDEKIAVMRQRVIDGLAVFHPDDATFADCKPSLQLQGSEYGEE